MREAMLRIRWRLMMGVISLVAVVAVSLPAAASTVDLGRRVAEIWPNGVQAPDEIWPNGASLMDVVWANATVLGGGVGSSQDGQNAQN